MNARLIVVSWVCLAFGGAFAQTPARPVPISVESLMTKEQQQEAGLDKLTPAERRKLDEVLARIEIRPGAKQVPTTVPATTNGTHWIATVSTKHVKDATVWRIRLEDDSVWEVAPFGDRAFSVHVQSPEKRIGKDSKVVLSPSDAPSYPFCLQNIFGEVYCYLVPVQHSGSKWNLFEDTKESKGK